MSEIGKGPEGPGQELEGRAGEPVEGSAPRLPRVVLGEVLAFNSNAEYIAWELSRVQARAQAYLASREAGSAARFLEVVAAQAGARMRVRSVREALVEEGKPIPFEWLVRRHRLSPLDEDALWVGLAMHLSTNTRALLLHAQGRRGARDLEAGFVCEMVSPAPDLLAKRAWIESDAPMVRHGLVRLRAPMAGGPRLGWSWEVPHHVAASVQGRLALNERLAMCATLRRPRTQLFELVLVEETLRQVDQFLEVYQPPRRGERTLSPWRVVVCGEEGTGKTSFVEVLAGVYGESLLSVRADRLLAQGDEAELLSLSSLNARFVHGVWHLVGVSALLSQRPSLAGLLRDLIEGYPGLVVLEERSRETLEQALPMAMDAVITMARPDARAREQLWEGLFPQETSLDAPEALGELAMTFELTGGQIKRALVWAERRARQQGRPGKLTREDLQSGAWAQLRSRLSQLAELSQVRLKLSDLVLPPEPMAQVLDLLAACRNRSRLLRDWGFGERLVTGKGLVALFLGEAGTGKTLTAEILAHELGQRLHIVSIPQIVSKWVGETEKNVREVFHQARAQHSILLFDEADALFARRVKVERSSDHFQNMEVNNLLQEIERFDGIVLLTTNLETNMDPAFARRILYRIEFPTPEAEQRAAIWRKLIPAQTPLEDDVDFEVLGEVFELTGGQIKNAIVRAAYRCLEDGVGLHYDALADAAQEQAAAAGRLVRQVELS